MIEFVKEFWHFLKRRKKLWLLPVVLAMLVLGGLLVLAQGSVIAFLRRGRQPGEVVVVVCNLTPVVRQERQFALRDALLERFPSDTESAATAGSHPRGNVWHH